MPESGHTWQKAFKGEPIEAAHVRLWTRGRVKHPDAPLIANELYVAILKAGAEVIGPTGKPFTEASIGMALATRDMMEDLRAMGVAGGGPKPFSQKDRSAFLQALDLAIQRLKRAGFGAGQP